MTAENTRKIAYKILNTLEQEIKLWPNVRNNSNKRMQNETVRENREKKVIVVEQMIVR